ncbi:MAG: hypothetical protein PF487_01235 [Bacteroidales bacterium]|jgi:3-keto-L-gulonate-6-phosphate decarboxylase|nr:hypothetical protein [Bacteroidales bacterium]
MTDTTHLVDELERLQVLKKKTDEELGQIKTQLIAIAEEQSSLTVIGTNKECTIKEYEKVIYPEDKTQLIDMIKQKGLYEEFSSVNYLRLGPKILKGEIDNEISNLTTKEKTHRISLKKKS